MLRRSFLAWAGACGLGAAASVAGYMRWREITPVVHAPGREEGHFLRDRKPLPAPSQALSTDVLILGSGVAALTAAWKLRKEGLDDFLMLDGPEPYGNAAGGRFGELAYPTGAHYLPLPTEDCFHVRELLSDLGVIVRGADARRPYYDERFVLHGPEDRLLFNGAWQEGVLPHEGVPAAELAEHKRFFAQIDALRGAVGADGRRRFTFPSERASMDAEARRLDAMSFGAWAAGNGYRSPSLLWYLDYCCRDDYGAGLGEVSAWAGLHYFCGRGGEAENAEQGAWLTWPEGLQALASGMERLARPKRLSGSAVRVRTEAERDRGVEVLCFALEHGVARTFTIRARRVICAMPLHVAARVVENMPDVHKQIHAPWMVSNFVMKRFPRELPSAPLSWDNVVHGTPGLGYVVSTHQDIRVTPPEKTVFTSYVALSGRDPRETRKWMTTASGEELLALASVDLRAAYGMQFESCVERVDITLRGHAMAVPVPGFRNDAGLLALREMDGPVLFAHSDMSGFSVFEEASWWGYRAAQRALRG
ncbi:FAD-dependent oxidoreductase [Pseudoduganella sp.]|uniref:FAD-dependent oxidoreductase n=1 Tax=Pseudoduganella sp. TaxID=1880898 RepID=UPI0035B469BE